MSTDAARRDALFERRPDIDALALPPGNALRYLAGYAFDRAAHGPDARCLYVAAGGDAALLVPALEADRARETIDGDPTVYGYEDDPGEAFARLRADLGWGSLGVDARAARLADLRALGLDPGELVDVSGDVDALRERKDEDELAALRRAAEITSDALGATLDAIEPGTTEREVHADLKGRVVRSAADGYGVGVVTSGPRTARVYADTTDRGIEDGDLVLIDTGVVYEGYYADVTRTVAVGEPTDEQRAMHAAVADALGAAMDAAEPGMAAGDLDGIARGVIADAGYGDAFVTTLGHGLGLDAHEPPYLGPESDRALREGSVFTVEPGVYVPGVGGVRIEEEVALTGDGAAVLTDLSRGL